MRMPSKPDIAYHIFAACVIGFIVGIMIGVVTDDTPPRAQPSTGANWDHIRATTPDKYGVVCYLNGGIFCIKVQEGTKQ